MYYEINVALNGHHFFATAPRSIVGESSLKRALTIFREKFPTSEGYEITATHECHVIKNVKIDEVLAG